MASQDNLRLLNLLEGSTVNHPDNALPVTNKAFIDDENAVDFELTRMLSLHSAVPTQAQSQNTNTYRKIGAGACGAIFAQDGQSRVTKLAKDSSSKELWNDFNMHLKVVKQFRRFIISDVMVPECYYYVPKSTAPYFENNPGLIEAAKDFCPPRAKQRALADPANKDCLVRVYLGSMKGKIGGMFFSLRNFKLHLNHMSELQLDAEPLARSIGTALAVIHWGVKLDARDVEFVLGSSTKKPLEIPDVDTDIPEMYLGPPTFIEEDFFRRTTELWVLDFNQVKSVTMDEAGVAKMVEAVKLNDPYFPKPLQESSIERHVWKAFVVSYLKASQVVL